MKEMIKNYRGTLISSGTGNSCRDSGRFYEIQGKWLNVFFIVMQCALVTIIFYDNRNRQQSRKGYRDDYMDHTCYYIDL